MRPCQRIRYKIRDYLGGWIRFLQHPVCFAGLGLALTFMTVLMFDSITVGEAFSRALIIIFPRSWKKREAPMLSSPSERVAHGFLDSIPFYRLHLQTRYIRSGCRHCVSWNRVRRGLWHSRVSVVEKTHRIGTHRTFRFRSAGVLHNALRRFGVRRRQSLRPNVDAVRKCRKRNETSIGAIASDDLERFEASKPQKVMGFHGFVNFRLFGDAVSNFTRSLGIELVKTPDPRGNTFSGNFANVSMYFINETSLEDPSHDSLLNANRSVVMLVAGMCLARFGITIRPWFADSIHRHRD